MMTEGTLRRKWLGLKDRNGDGDDKSKPDSCRRIPHCRNAVHSSKPLWHNAVIFWSACPPDWFGHGAARAAHGVRPTLQWSWSSGAFFGDSSKDSSVHHITARSASPNCGVHRERHPRRLFLLVLLLHGARYPDHPQKSVASLLLPLRNASSSSTIVILRPSIPRDLALSYHAPPCTTMHLALQSQCHPSG